MRAGGAGGVNSSGAGGIVGTGGVIGAAGMIGAGGVIGSGGAGGACQIAECFVANNCLAQCGGKIVYTGCCPCVPPAVDQKTCASSQ